jgi:hypothetical protein
MCLVVPQDYLGTGACDLDHHHVSCWCKKYRLLEHLEGGFVVCFSSRHSDGERLACGGFSVTPLVFTIATNV